VASEQIELAFLNKGDITPFPEIPSLLVTATVLSYYDYCGEVRMLMN